LDAKRGESRDKHIKNMLHNNGTLVDLARPKYPNYVSFTTEINIYQQERTYLPGQPGMRRTNTIQFLVTVVYINIGREKASSCMFLP